MNMIDVIKQQHHEIEEVFRQLETTDNIDEQTPLRAELADMIAAHMLAENTQFFPYVVQALGNGWESFDGVMLGREEHAVTAFALTRLMSVPVSDETFKAKLAMMKDVFFNHLEEEEFETLAMFEAAMDRQTMNESDAGDKLDAAFHTFMRDGYVKLLPMLMGDVVTEDMLKQKPTTARKVTTKKPIATKKEKGRGGKVVTGGKGKRG
jgi:iron-sulfur cluster repair protein YtfE (RIC family)